jgi:hypothetical protein
MMDHIRKFKGWQRALRKFEALYAPQPVQGFRAPVLTAGQVSEIEQTRQRLWLRRKGLKRRDYLVGLEVDRLLVWELAALDHAPWWWCLCGCGNFLKVQSLELIHGRIGDCGCVKRERQRITRLRKAA